MTGRRDRYGDVIEDADEHTCDQGWVERPDGRVAHCPSCTTLSAPALPRALPQPKLTEAHWQARIIDLAELRGWKHFHPYSSRRSTPGWPDLVLVRDGRLIFAELKTDTGRVTADQQTWLAQLAAVPFIEVHVWRPADWPNVMAALR